MLTMRRILVMLTAMVALAAGAQRPIRRMVTQLVPPDSLDVTRHCQKHPWRAAAEVAGFNAGLWAFDRFVIRGDYAYVTLNSIKENFRKGFHWDNDQLGTNMFMHPFNGSIYYNMARANGLNFWQSGLYALGGSAMWEMFCENEYPSTNDIIATPVGGVALGEVSYRAADLITDDRARGWGRFGREAAAFILNPGRGITRLINGDAWRVRSTSGRQFGIPNIAVDVGLGARLLDFKGRLFDDGAGMAVQCNVEYGERFTVEPTYTPYDYFTVNAELNFFSSQPVLGRLNITGRLLGREFLKDREQVLNVGLYQHFDYYDSDTISTDHVDAVPYKLGVPASLGCGVMYRDVQRGRFVLDAFLHVNAVGLAGILSDYYRLDNRNYNLASGFSLHGGAEIVMVPGVWSLSAECQFYRLFTWKGYPDGTDWATANERTLSVQGDRSVASFAVTQLRAARRLQRHLYAVLQVNHFYRSTRYRQYAPVRSSSWAFELLLTWKF